MARSKQPKGKFVNDPRTQKIIELAAQMLGDDAYKGKSVTVQVTSCPCPGDNRCPCTGLQPGHEKKI